MANNYQYCVAKNWGKGFIEVEESSKFQIRNFPGNVWRLPVNNKDANLWISRVLGVVKTKNEAQEIVNSHITQRQNLWDNDNRENETPENKIKRKGPRPFDITLLD
jgi:hypothetical protein